MTDIDAIVKKIDDIQQIHTDSLKIANDLNAIGTPDAKRLSLSISTAVLLINVECTRILDDYKNIIKDGTV